MCTVQNGYSNGRTSKMLKGVGPCTADWSGLSTALRDKQSELYAAHSSLKGYTKKPVCKIKLFAWLSLWYLNCASDSSLQQLNLQLVHMHDQYPPLLACLVFQSFPISDFTFQAKHHNWSCCESSCFAMHPCFLSTV